MSKHCSLRGVVLMMMSFIACMFISIIGNGQVVPQKKVKILLLGIEKLPPSTADYFYGITDLKREKELKEIQSNLVRFFPNKIFIDYPSIYQDKMDSMYSRFGATTNQPDADEFEQFGFKIAAKLQLKQLICIQSFASFDLDSTDRSAKNNNQLNIIANRDSITNKLQDELYHNILKMSIKDFLIYLNSKAVFQKDIDYYLRYTVKIGNESNYTGADEFVDFYSSILHSYANILRNIQPSDKAVLVVCKHQSAAILKTMFEMNPDFEIVSVADILK